MKTGWTMVAIVALAGCAPGTPPAEGTAVADNAADAAAGTDPVRTCDGAKAAALIGRLADVAVQEEARRLAGARTIRLLPPGAMMTMDFRGDRLNISTDAAGRITRLHCA